MANKRFRLQGGSVSQALENVLKASHIILTRNIQTGVGSQMMMQSSILGRLGMANSKSPSPLYGTD